MFRRLAESFTTVPADQSQSDYLANQALYYNTLLPNIIPTNGSAPAPTGIVSALQGVDPILNRPILPLQATPQGLSKIFYPMGSDLMAAQKECETASLDGLLSSQNPDKPVRCGWTYSPPTGVNPLPQISKGSLGTRNGAFSSLSPNTNFQKWFWDLNAAKQQVLTDTCKSLKNCSDVTNAPYQGVCGYCTDIGQGVPVDANGNALYTGNSLTYCSPSSIITSAAACPAPPSAVGQGKAPQVSNICSPVNGKLTSECLETVIQEGGCSTQGALATALATGATPTDYMASARTLPSMQLYNRTASTPFNLDIFSQGQTTITAALQAVNTLAANATGQSATSALGASARDLCLTSGAIDQFNFCSELTPTTPPPFTLDCLQNQFLQLGGQETGSMYPTTQSMSSFYNTLPSWGAVVSYMQNLAAVAQGGSGGSFLAQQDALNKLRGINLQINLPAPWTGLSTTLTQISVGDGNHIAGVDIDGNPWYYGGSGSSWKQLPMPPTTPIRQISVASTNTTTSVAGVVNLVCISGTLQPGTNGIQVYVFLMGKWIPLPALLMNITTGAPNTWWGINNNNNAYYATSPFFEVGWRTQYTGQWLQFSIGSDYTLWAIDPTNTLYSWANNIWNKQATNIAQVANGNSSNVWAIDTNQNVYRWNGTQFIQQPGSMQSISVGSDGFVAGISSNGSLVQWSGNTWTTIQLPTANPNII